MWCRNCASLPQGGGGDLAAGGAGLGGLHRASCPFVPRPRAAPNVLRVRPLAPVRVEAERVAPGQRPAARGIGPASGGRGAEAVNPAFWADFFRGGKNPPGAPASASSRPASAHSDLRRRVVDGGTGARAARVAARRHQRFRQRLPPAGAAAAAAGRPGLMEARGSEGPAVPSPANVVAGLLLVARDGRGSPRVPRVPARRRPAFAAPVPAPPHGYGRPCRRCQPRHKAM